MASMISVSSGVTLVGLAVRHGLLAPAEDGGGAHGAEGDAHGVGVGGDVVAGGDGALIVLGHGIPHAGPQVAGRGVGDDLRVDENVVGRDLGEGVLPQAAVRMVHDAKAGAGGAGGGDGGEGEEGPVGLVGQHLAGVDGLPPPPRRSCRRPPPEARSISMFSREASPPYQKVPMISMPEPSTALRI